MLGSARSMVARHIAYWEETEFKEQEDSNRNTDFVDVDERAQPGTRVDGMATG